MNCLKYALKYYKNINTLFKMGVNEIKTTIIVLNR